MRRPLKLGLAPAIALLGLLTLLENEATAAPPPPCLTADGVIGPEWVGVTPTFVPYAGITGDSRDGQLVGFNVYVRADSNCFYMAFQAVPVPSDRWDEAYNVGLGSSANIYLDTDVDGNSDLIIEALAGDYCKATASGCGNTATINDPALGPNVWSVGNAGMPSPTPMGGVREVAIPWVTLQTDPDNLGFDLTTCSVNLRTVQAFGYNFSGSQFPNRFGTYSQPGCVPTSGGKVTGGGQISVTGGKGTFGFNAKHDVGTTGSGHLNYMKTGVHLDCTVTAVTELTANTAKFSGSCSTNSSALSFMARVEDNAEPGKNADRFFITYGTTTDEGGTLISGNIQIQK